MTDNPTYVWNGPGVTALVVVGILVGPLVAYKRGHLLAAALPTPLLWAFAWVVPKVAQDADYWDADGWVDCWRSCSRVQHAVGVSLWIGPLVALSHSRRGRRGNGDPAQSEVGRRSL